VNDDSSPFVLQDAVAAPRRWTYDETLATLPESNRPAEIWDGDLIVSPTPSLEHQEIVLRFARFLQDWTEPRSLGKVFIAPLDMVLSPHRVTQPDIGFVAAARLDIIQRVLRGPADLVAEVVSLGGRNRDRIEKRDLYEQHGIKEYWILDPEPGTVDVLFLESASFQLTGRYHAGQSALSRLLPGFQVAVDRLFSGVRGGV
jgi:Uma2 family endonuclease